MHLLEIAGKLIQGEAMVLIRDGKVDGKVMHRYRITNDDLHTTLHDKGLLSVDQVKRAYVEADGAITIIEAD